MKHNAFTLMEMMVSIVIFSIMVLFLYKSYAQLHVTNNFFAEKSQELGSYLKKKQTVYLDFTLAHYNSVKILNQNKDEDVVFMQTNNSLYGRIHPYVAYIKKDKELYRLESLRPFENYPLESDSDFFGESLGEVKGFRVYAQSGEGNNAASSYLVHIDFAEEDALLYKVVPLNEE
ncbi:MAG: prepilin-type N-terminal cleavage/methylation domain-containing protein [Helicobacteraceae bacterium]|nr:prepilin-type N-terminal cleavage/methylation domain-containing protein [Helicobacteraceae bacterium]